MPHSEDLDGILLDPEDEPPAEGDLAARMGRMRPLSGAFARVPIQWLVSPDRPHVFPAEARLFTYVLYRSRWGQRGVAATNAFAAEIGLSARAKHRAIEKLEGKGWVRVDRTSPHSAPIVWPLVLTE